MAFNKIGAGYKKTTQKGANLISVKLTLDGKEYRITLWENPYKDSETKPDYNVTLDERSGNGG